MCTGNQLLDTLPLCERRRVASLEPFDEWEGWHLLCSHMVLVAAVSGDICRLSAVFRQQQSGSYRPNSPTTGNGSATGEFSTVRVSTLGGSVIRFGHTAALMCTGRSALILGGFGEDSDNRGRHCRLSSALRLTVVPACDEKEGFGDLLSVCVDSVHIHAAESSSSTTCTPLLGQGLQGHTQTPVSNGAHLVVGGRRGPTQPLDQAVLITPSTTGAEIHMCCEVSEMPARWRHTAVYLNNPDRGCEVMKYISEFWCTAAGMQTECMVICGC